MALRQVADVVLVEILVEGGSQQLLGQVGEDGRGSAGGRKVSFTQHVDLQLKHNSINVGSGLQFLDFGSHRINKTDPDRAASMNPDDGGEEGGERGRY